MFSLLTEAIMQDATLIGIDLGKHSFHLHGQDRHGKLSKSLVWDNCV